MSEDILRWQDLTADEVYHIAYSEDEARSMADASIGKITQYTGIAQTRVLEINARKALEGHEAYAQSWLGCLATLRELRPEVIEGRLLRQARQALGLSKKAAAELLGVARSTITQLEAEQHAPRLGLREQILDLHNRAVQAQRQDPAT